ncbi:hypothetical protein GJ496_010448 [Pomphorhynchus laevis]|nr:hypothetical protein GJ496_010448 [Pomphorhynchus laevis]
MQRLLATRLCRLNFTRFAANRDWQPGPYPRTEEECKAAAAKYGLLAEDYKPFPDNSLGTGDYPDIQAVAVDERDPYENWDDPYFCRDFGEVFHQEGYERYHPNRIGTRYEYNRRPSKMLAWLVLPWSTLLLLLYFTRNWKYCSLMMPKQYLYETLLEERKHYTFEPLTNDDK